MNSIGLRVRSSLELVLGGPIADGDVVRDLEPRWTSIKNIEFMFVLEDEFSLILSEADLAEFHCLSSVVQAVTARVEPRSERQSVGLDAAGAAVSRKV